MRACRGRRLIGQIGELLDTFRSLAEQTDDFEPLRTRHRLAESGEHAENGLLLIGDIGTHASMFD